tara:strand:- start:1090 stop:1461 length:372 start_codon:yes stop_codon:yes gene_type:complete
MHIKYKIIGFSTKEHTIVVRYFSDVTTEEDLANVDPESGEIIRHSDGSIQTCRTDVNITLWDVPALTGSALEEFISSCAPKQWFDLMEKVKDPAVDTTLSSIEGMVGEEREAVILPERTTAIV